MAATTQFYKITETVVTAADTETETEVAISAERSAPKEPEPTCQYCFHRKALKTDSNGRWTCKRCLHPPVYLRSERVPRNMACPCGSTKKYKRCCMRKVEAMR